MCGGQDTQEHENITTTTTRGKRIDNRIKQKKKQWNKASQHPLLVWFSLSCFSNHPSSILSCFLAFPTCVALLPLPIKSRQAGESRIARSDLDRNPTTALKVLHASARPCPAAACYPKILVEAYGPPHLRAAAASSGVRLLAACGLVCDRHARPGLDELNDDIEPATAGCDPLDPSRSQSIERPPSAATHSRAAVTDTSSATESATWLPWRVRR